MTSEDITEEDADIRVDETTALLASSAGKQTSLQTDSSSDDAEEDDKPLPKDQIFLLCFARLVEPIAFFCIFPFINQMIWDTGEVAETDVGFYSGLIVSHGLYLHLLHHYDGLSLMCNPGVSILANTNASHDPLGSSSRLLGTKTHPRLITGRRGPGNRPLRP